ncbi:MAG: hypothetical protein KKA35_06175 [Proteobacteria bacterium]|nr:hypothetical protein [Pseudomonadota bacterium]
MLYIKQSFQIVQIYTKSIIISGIVKGKEKQRKNLQKVRELVHNHKAFEGYIRDEITGYLLSMQKPMTPFMVSKATALWFGSLSSMATNIAAVSYIGSWLTSKRGECSWNCFCPFISNQQEIKQLLVKFNTYFSLFA